jgi:aryl-alcohol dehydrogenase-like predicted oxidoreductase
LAIIVDTLADTADFYDHRLQEKLGGAVFLRERDEDEIEV